MAKKLKIKEVGGSAEFVVMLNPSHFTHNHSISYSGSNESGGGTGTPLTAEKKYESYGPETISFEIVLDGTGVTNIKPVPKSVNEQINSLKKLVYKLDGKKHEPNVVTIIWGTFIFQGRLTKIDIDYTLFKPDGSVLRAKVALGFTGYIPVEKQGKKAGMSSPDLTHIIEVKAGDTLALLCHEIYKDSSYHVEVARHNNLTSLRKIKPGTRLYFPPLI